MKKLKNVLLLGSLICCSVATLKAQDNKKADALARDREQLKTNSEMAGTITTASGLEYQICVKGTGQKPKKNSKIIIGYRLNNTEGQTLYEHFDKPLECKVSELLTGLQEGVKLMPAGSTWLFWMPSRLCTDKTGKVVGDGRVLLAYVHLITIK